MSQFGYPTTLLFAAIALASPASASADEQTDCTNGGGTLLIGVVVARPAFAHGKPLRGIPLSHTHVRIRSDADSKIYDVAVDDVFAAGYDPLISNVPPPLSSITVGIRIEACGMPYSGGMHWVHTNCGATPTAQDPNGWLKVIDATGTVGSNLEDSQRYCYLWPGKSSHRSRHPHSVPPST